MQRFGLLLRIIIAIALGIIVGIIANDWLIRLFATFNDIFGGFLSFIIPLIIIGFIAPGIGYMGKGAGKLLSITALVAYISTIFAGIIAFITASNLYPAILSGQSLTMFNDPSSALLEGFLDFELHPPLEVITALILSFILGIGMAALKNDTLLNVFTDLRSIVELVISKVIIPLLPIHIFGIFANMTHAGQVASILQVFAVVFVMIVLLHILYLILQYSVAGALNKQNPFRMLKTMLPAYFTALGTQSSAATIPVTLAQAKKLKVKGNIADFTIPLLANIHLSGSTITLLSCATAVLFLQGDSITFGSVFPFLLVLGVTMIAAPGVPGGAVMASIGLLESMLGFGPTMVSLMIALYLAQDSLGTACNVTGDGAITSITDSINNRWSISK
ncbi:dicarboxylate/amino acid:cation symporter [Oceanobacillus jeddahense]|uniref:Dicarboxylate/amino acid:cation symporter n=1 Tax=Oceanobacillus jeddahense TaxID=1462527 RepID=A0ABY5JNL0_9BACI|nr:dicarboxylate/amino acid:cation symporter [Oceanobacillus jeddahense]UUI01890.1 dicarboxylate/amino acid:cation symporter [Oceanobacillus jeddahense]